MHALDIQGLEKTYDNGFSALKGIDFQVNDGEFFALLGPNGAGKSTTIGIIASLVQMSAGRVSIFGHDIVKQPLEARRSLGLVPQEFNFNAFENPMDIVCYQAGYYGIKRAEAQPRAEQLLKQLDLWEKRKTPSRMLSGGMKRRLMIARALVHQPKLLILDEPTAGVDIEIRRSMWAFLQEINQAGTAIILTTHYLEEAEALCKRVAIIDQGRIVEDGKVEDLLSQAMSETFILDVDHSLRLPDETLENGVRLTLESEGRLAVEVPRGESLNEVFAALSQRGVAISSMRNKANRLEEFFLRLVTQNKHAAREQGPETGAQSTEIRA